MHEYSLENVQSLRPYENNARTHSEDQLKQLCDSIEQFGFTNPILIDENAVVLAGHGRLMAAELLGMNEVPCITVRGLSDHQKRAYIIADNQLALNAGWDLGLLKTEISALDLADFNLDLLGFDGNFLNDLFASTHNEGEGGEGGSEPQNYPLTINCTSEDERDHLKDRLIREGYQID